MGLPDREAKLLQIAVVNPSKGSSGGYRKYMQTLIPLLRDDTHVVSLDLYAPPGAWAAGLEGFQVTQWPAGDRWKLLIGGEATREFDWRITAEKTFSELELAARAEGNSGEQALP